MRLGLCCVFHEEPIKFRTTTATALMKLSRDEALSKVSGLCLANAEALQKALDYCHAVGIGSFRVGSGVLPVKTHAVAGYEVSELPDAAKIRRRFRACGAFARKHGIRTVFHPDQFVVLSSADDGVVERSVKDLIYQATVGEWIGVDVLNIHGGGAYGDKPSALARLEANIRKLPAAVRERLTLENDDKVYTPSDLLPVCRRLGIPLVYDVHHHRCLPDGLTVAQATEQSLATWNREPLFHVSSPKEGWTGPKPNRHHDYIDSDDFPEEWYALDITVEVEAKAKEVAVLALQRVLDAGSDT